MPAIYENHGIRFLFPENWELEEEEAEGQCTVCVQSPETAFWSITVDETGRSPRELALAALEVFQGEYDPLDVADTKGNVGSWSAIGYDLAFFCLDLTNTCCIRAFQTGQRSVMLLFQATDSEWDKVEPVFRAISTSLQC